ncbi:MFS transporter, partial [Rhizobium johnstonii]|uniref:MFS transporter n=1 Tax=Rhizobium johnstonii TaxID=3019933 RepID=UPI003F9B0C22
PNGRRGYFTSWIQMTATLGLFLSLIVIVFVQYLMGAADFAAWGWRIPFLVSVVLLGISVWIRLKMNESPAFHRMKASVSGALEPLPSAFM